jgi:hypothetical protein
MGADDSFGGWGGAAVAASLGGSDFHTQNPGPLFDQSCLFSPREPAHPFSRPWCLSLSLPSLLVAAYGLLRSRVNAPIDVTSVGVLIIASFSSCDVCYSQYSLPSLVDTDHESNYGVIFSVSGPGTTFPSSIRVPPCVRN